MEIAHNELEGSVPCLVPSALNYDISYNRFTGTLPSSLCQVRESWVIERACMLETARKREETKLEDFFEGEGRGSGREKGDGRSS